MNKGKLIVLEGGDGAGKATQAELMIKALKTRKVKVFLQDFPRYETSLFGKLCGEALHGEHGDFTSMSPYIACLPYSLDRAGVAKEIKDQLKKGVVVSNRYTSSNLAFQSAKLAPELREKFANYLERVEFEEFGLPRPHLVIYLYVPPKVASTLVSQKSSRSWLGGKKGAKDLHESKPSFQEEVMRVYLKLAKERKDWVAINCMKGGKILPKEVIHKMVMKEVDKALAKK